MKPPDTSIVEPCWAKIEFPVCIATVPPFTVSWETFLLIIPAKDVKSPNGVPCQKVPLYSPESLRSTVKLLPRSDEFR